MLDTKKNNIDLLGDDEIFVQLEDTQHYWISNHGRLTNNMRKDKRSFFHKTDSGNPAYKIYEGIYARCYGGSSLFVNCYYDDAYMCDEWKNSRDSFAEWYAANYYECGGERMAVDKELLNRGNKEYAPDKCCILPEAINSALASATKRRSRYKSTKGYAIGVDYDKARDKFFARITPFGHPLYKMACMVGLI